MVCGWCRNENHCVLIHQPSTSEAEPWRAAALNYSTVGQVPFVFRLKNHITGSGSPSAKSYRSYTSLIFTRGWHSVAACSVQSWVGFEMVKAQATTFHLIYLWGCSKPHYSPNSTQNCSSDSQVFFLRMSGNGKDQLVLLSNMIYFQPFIKSIWLQAWRGIKQWYKMLAHSIFVRMKL